MRRGKNKKPQLAVALLFVVAMIFSHTLFASAAVRYDVNRDGKFIHYIQNAKKIVAKTQVKSDF